MAILFDRYPVSAARTRGFSRTQDPYGSPGWGHLGIDFGAQAGSPIYATREGVIAYSGWSQNMPNSNRIGYAQGNTDGGIITVIDHGGFGTNYLHQSRTIVSTGQRVSRGQLIGYVGNTGNSQGAHLHYEYMPYFPIRDFNPPVLGRENPDTVTNATNSPNEGDWFEMATKEELKAAIREVINEPSTELSYTGGRYSLLYLVRRNNERLAAIGEDTSPKVTELWRTMLFGVLGRNTDSATASAFRKLFAKNGITIDEEQRRKEITGS